LAKEDVPLNIAHRLLAGNPLVLLTFSLGELVDISTVPWCSPLSLTPPQVGVSVFAYHFTHDLLSRVETFAINVVPRDWLRQARFCGTVSGREVDKFKQTGFTPDEAREVEAPLIVECIGHLECGVVGQHTLGDHTLFVAQVLAASAEKDLFDSAWQIKERDLRPVVHLGKDYFGVWEDRFEVLPAEPRS
jgi:flavin reductase (DIM6/NTAB) family NADH-FMN oxidoreductase RutF